MHLPNLLKRAAAVGFGAIFASGLLAQTGIHVAQDTVVRGTGLLAAQTKVAGSPQIVALRDTFLMVGNTYAARSKDQGQTWRYYDPNQLFTSQKGIANDSMRLVKPAKFDMAIWVMAHNPAQSNTNNSVRVAVTKGRAGLRDMTFRSTLLPGTSLGAASGQLVRVQDVATDDQGSTSASLS